MTDTARQQEVGERYVGKYRNHGEYVEDYNFSVCSKVQGKWRSMFELVHKPIVQLQYLFHGHHTESLKWVLAAFYLFCSGRSEENTRGGGGIRQIENI